MRGSEEMGVSYSWRAQRRASEYYRQKNEFDARMSQQLSVTNRHGDENRVIRHNHYHSTGPSGCVLNLRLKRLGSPPKTVLELEL